MDSSNDVICYKTTVYNTWRVTFETIKTLEEYAQDALKDIITDYHPYRIYFNDTLEKNDELEENDELEKDDELKDEEPKAKKNVRELHSKYSLISIENAFYGECSQIGARSCEAMGKKLGEERDSLTKYLQRRT